MVADSPPHCLRHRKGQRTDGGVVEVETTLPDGELWQPPSEVHGHAEIVPGMTENGPAERRGFG
jgi:hypothetical protein